MQVRVHPPMAQLLSQREEPHTSLSRLTFVGALVVAIVGGLAGMSFAASFFSSGDAPRALAVAARSSATPTPRPHATNRLRHRVGSAPLQGRGHQRPPVRRQTITVKPKSTATPTPTPTATPTVTPTPTGTVTLAGYSVSYPTARRGATITVAYTIDNETGRALRLTLGASIKPSRLLSWTSSYSDPADETTVLAPPGRSLQVRRFVVSAGLRDGQYDVAWGLRDVSTGQHVALASAPGALTIVG